MRQDLYTLNYKILMKGIYKIQINGNKFYAHGLKKLCVLKYLYYPKGSTRFNAIPFKTPLAFFQ